MRGRLENNGRAVVFRILNNIENKQSQSEPLFYLNQTFFSNNINVNGGPLSYSYTFDSIYIHFGANDKFGSEHYIAGSSFPAEVIKFIRVN